MRRRELLGAAGVLTVAGPVLAQTPPPVDGVTTERVAYQSNGKTIRAIAFRPGANANGAGVVYIHGSGGMGLDQLAFARQFAVDGYLALAPTYLDAAEDDVVRREPTMEAWRDCARDGIEWLIGQSVDRRRTGVVGYSLGSYIAVDGALGDSRASAAIAVCGGWDVYIPRHPTRRIPVLILRSERDRVVSPASTQRWRQFLLDADVPVRVQVTRGAGHLMTAAQWSDVYTRSQTFFAEQLGVSSDRQEP
ncbi:dienelactone hydrolase family protein [Brevundimonas goettingensis]|uniref:Dienelactone hydrolase family protein n=1 Tax=Brevundimonas goettingensis TaxID=2774190 RepID=A0A975C384_9CAUL|nr:dienelactone hydrolase family protein [Brevundimonas goettingensis]QTC93016.1 dienelactone hydrolase family protein [Brevundimonas goettingensis]